MASRHDCSWHQREGGALEPGGRRGTQGVLAWGAPRAGVAPSKAQILAVLLSSLGFLLLLNPLNPLIPDVPSLSGAPEAGRHPSGSGRAEPSTARLCWVLGLTAGFLSFSPSSAFLRKMSQAIGHGACSA